MVHFLPLRFRQYLNNVKWNQFAEHQVQSLSHSLLENLRQFVCFEPMVME
jgi:hypothetical protein